MAYHRCEISFHDFYLPCRTGSTKTAVHSDITFFYHLSQNVLALFLAEPTPGTASSRNPPSLQYPTSIDDPPAKVPMETSAASQSHPEEQFISSQSQSTQPTPSQETPSASSPSQPTTKTCAHCSAPEPAAEAEKPLKDCIKCHSVSYCGRDCQKADMKKHKKVCAAAAQIYAQTANVRPVTSRAPPRDAFRGGLQKWQFDT
jgi:hypothetical protein